MSLDDIGNTDRDEVGKAAQGDQNAWSAIYDKYSAAIMSVLIAKGVRPSDVDDVRQEVFASLFVFFLLSHNFKIRFKFRAILSKLIQWRAADYFRHHNAHRDHRGEGGTEHLEFLEEVFGDHSGDPLNGLAELHLGRIADDEAYRDQVFAELRLGLSPRQAQVFGILTNVDWSAAGPQADPIGPERTHKDLAAELNMLPGNFARAFTTIRRKFVSLLELGTDPIHA